MAVSIAMKWNVWNQVVVVDQATNHCSVHLSQHLHFFHDTFSHFFIPHTRAPRRHEDNLVRWEGWVFEGEGLEEPAKRQRRQGSP